MNKKNITHTKQSFGRRIVRKALGNTTAKIGLFWIFLLVLVATFAPFLANTVPLAVHSADAGTQYPVLRFLSVEDVIVISVFFTVLLLFLFRFKALTNLVLLIVVTTAVSILANVFVKPPSVVLYDDYRNKTFTDKYDWVVMPPIPYSPTDYLRDYGDTGLEKPLLKEDQREHWMGTEENGADVLSRMIHASRIALGIGFIATGIAMFIGVIIGGLMGYFSGIVDMIGMRLVEIFEAVPTLFLLLTFVAFFGRSIYIMMIIIGITSWSGYARYIRAEFLKLRKQDYVQAAVASGLPLSSILFRHMLPNGVAPLLVAASFGVASAILAEATLSFLGLGLVDAPSWGQMLNQAVQSSSFHWWMAAFPGGAIFMTVFAYNLVGESFRDAIDPQLSQKAGVAS